MIRSLSAAMIAALAASSPAAAQGLGIDVRATPDGRAVLLLEGPLRRGDSARVKRALDSGSYAEVHFDSPGGSVVEGYAIGEALRERNALARIPAGAYCVSACVDAFLGAPVRFVDEPFSIGIHPGSMSGSADVRGAVQQGARRGDAAVRDIIIQLEQMTSQMQAEWTRYVLRMGASVSLTEYALGVPHNCALMLSRNEMLLFNIVNTGGPPPRGFRPGESRRICNRRVPRGARRDRRAARLRGVPRRYR